MKHIREIVILAACLMVLGFSASALFGIWQRYQEGAREYRGLQEYAHEGDETETETDESGEVKTKRKPEVDFDALKKINGDVVAWIRCKELGLDYPVVQGTDNSYYLTHSFSGEEHISGCIFMDCINEADFSDDNTILYGHNMKDGSMFGSFSAFRGDTVTVFLYTPEEAYVYEIADNLVADVNDEKYFRTVYSTEAFGELSEAVAVRTGTALMPGTHLLTLSTCSSNASERHLILCKRVADAEEKETEVGKTDASEPETYAVVVKATETDEAATKEAGVEETDAAEIGVEETDTAETGAEGTNPAETKAEEAGAADAVIQIDAPTAEDGQSGME